MSLLGMHSCCNIFGYFVPDPGTPYHGGPSDFKFQPPLPPGSPCFSSPPPLPLGTPPATPTRPPLPKGTPPPTPTNGSPALRGHNYLVVDETVEGAEDELTLEELEEQQRLIWAALENATNSDCETPATGTPVPSSPSVSTPVHGDTETEEAEEPMDTTIPAPTCNSSENERDSSVQEGSPQSPGPIKAKEESPQSPGPVKSQDDSPESPETVKVQLDNPQSPGPLKSLDDTPQRPAPIKYEEDNPQSPDPDNSAGGTEGGASPNHGSKVTAVPHRSKFAAGIVPFEDTPEYTEVAEATGTYLRIRDLLKCSPRSLAKKKNVLP